MPKKKLDKDVASARKKLLVLEAEARASNMHQSQVSYVIAYKDNEPAAYPMIDRGCFGGLMDRTHQGRSSWAQGKDIVGFISLIIPARGQGSWPNHPPLKAKDRDQYLGWAINRSPWASAFITKSVGEGRKRGLVCDVNVPSNFLIGGLMAVRAVTDNPQKITVWAELVKHGLDETYAYLASHFFSPYRKKFQRVPSLSFRGEIYPSAEHMALGHYFFRSRQAISNFLNERVMHPRDAFKDSTIFTIAGRSIHHTWGRGNGTTTWLLDCPIMGEAKKVAAAWNSASGVGAGGVVNKAPRSHHTVYRTPEEKAKLVASITKQFDTIKAGTQ